MATTGRILRLCSLRNMASDSPLAVAESQDPQAPISAAVGAGMPGSRYGQVQRRAQEGRRAARPLGASPERRGEARQLAGSDWTGVRLIVQSRPGAVVSP